MFCLNLSCHFSWNENLQQKQNWIVKSTDLEENAGKIDSFCHQSSAVSRKLGRCLEYYRSWKSTLRKFAFAVNTGGHSIQVFYEKSLNKGGNFRPMWLEILKSLWYGVADSLQVWYSWLWAVASYTTGSLYSLLCPEMDWIKNTHQKARLCVYFNWF